MCQLSLPFEFPVYNSSARSVRKESRTNTWRYFSNKMSNARVNLGCMWTSCEHLDTLCLMCHYAPVCIHPCFWLLVLFFLVLFFLPVHGIPCTCIRPYRELASVSALLPFVYHTLLHILFSLWFVQPFSFCPISRYIIQVAYIWMLLLGAWKVKKVVCPWQLLLL